MFQQIVEKFNANKAAVIRVGGAVVGALVGSAIAAAVTAEQEPEWSDADEVFEDLGLTDEE